MNLAEAAAVTGAARQLVARVLAGVPDGEADSGVVALDDRLERAQARGEPPLWLTQTASAGAAALMVVWFRTRWRALVRGLMVIAMARLARVYARAVGSGEDRLSCTARLHGGYSLRRLLVQMKGQFELHVPVVGRFRIECVFNSLDDSATEANEGAEDVSEKGVKLESATYCQEEAVVETRKARLLRLVDEKEDAEVVPEFEEDRGQSGHLPFGQKAKAAGEGEPQSAADVQCRRPSGSAARVWAQPSQR